MRKIVLEENGKKVTIEMNNGEYIETVDYMIQDLVAPSLLAQTYSKETIASGFLSWIEENVPDALNGYGAVEDDIDDDSVFDPRGYGNGGDNDDDDYQTWGAGGDDCGTCGESTGNGQCENCKDDIAYKNLGNVEINLVDEQGNQLFEDDGTTPLMITMSKKDFAVLESDAERQGKTIESVFNGIISDGLNRWAEEQATKSFLEEKLEAERQQIAEMQEMARLSIVTRQDDDYDKGGSVIITDKETDFTVCEVYDNFPGNKVFEATIRAEAKVRAHAESAGKPLAPYSKTRMAKIAGLGTATNAPTESVHDEVLRWRSGQPLRSSTL